MYTLQLKAFGYFLRYMYRVHVFLGRHRSDQDWTETCNKATKMMKTFIKETTFCTIWHCLAISMIKSSICFDLMEAE